MDVMATSPVARIALTALCFRVVEWFYTQLALPWVRRMLKGNTRAIKKGHNPAESTAIQIATRMIAFTHNLIQLPLATLILLDPRFWGNPLYHHTSLSAWVVTTSAGYFLHDLVNCVLRFELEGPAYLLHGFACCAVYSYAVLSGNLHFYGAAFLMWELSTPFVHLRWLLFKFQKDNGILYMLNGVAMNVAFFLCRVVWGTLASVHFVWSTSRELESRNNKALTAAVYMCYAMMVALNCLNYFWFTKMFSKTVQIVLQGKQSASVGSEKDE